MTLGEIIKGYRENHKMSMDAFSEKSGISKAYISVLEKNQHPKTGKAVAPSVHCIKQAADGMGMNFDALFSMLDGEIILSDAHTPPETPPAVNDTLTTRETAVVTKYRHLDDLDKGKIDERMDTMLEDDKYKRGESSDVREIS